METPRNDASFGLWLKGDGNGDFVTQEPRDSGLVMEGDVRNIELINVDDKRYLLVAANNKALQKIKIN